MPVLKWFRLLEKEEGKNKPEREKQKQHKSIVIPYIAGTSGKTKKF